MSINEPKVIELNRTEIKCAGFNRLTQWQVNRYRTAVDDHRIAQSKEKERVVDWRSAEQDYCDSGKCAKQAKTWRTEFCSLICPERNSCELALQFFQTPAAAKEA